MAWLAPLAPQAKETGFILPRDHSQRVDNLLKAAKEAAGLWPWSPRFQNTLRKSFCSYHYEMFGSADRTAEYPGHDLRTPIKTYRHAVAHEEAAKFLGNLSWLALARNGLRGLGKRNGTDAKRWA